jgi:hypothetical protein
MSYERVIERVAAKIAGRDSEYSEYFEKKLREWDVKNPDEIPDDKKSEFFKEVDDGWKSADEVGKDGKKAGVIPSITSIREQIHAALGETRRATAGTILGPGVPDGTGPARGSGFCPFDEQEEAVVASEIARTAQHLLNVKTLEPLNLRETTRAIRDAIIAEESAINQYETVVDSTDILKVKVILQDIANEERVHVGELQKLLTILLEDEQGFLDDGASEVED